MEGEYKRDYRIELILASGKRVSGIFVLDTTWAHCSEGILLTLRWGMRKIQKREGDAFAAMREIRRELDREGILLNCYGASRDVHPSEMMSMDTAFGTRAFRLTPGRPPTMEDIVGIFDTGPDIQPSTVEGQEKYYADFLRGGPGDRRGPQGRE